MKTVCLFFCLFVVWGVSWVDAQEVSAPTTLNDRRAALFSASRLKMFDPSANWSDARSTVGQRAGASDAESGQMLQKMGESSTLESLRANPMNMFLTTGSLQELMALDTALDSEIIDSLDGAALTGLGTDDVNAGRAAAQVNSTGLYAPRFVATEQRSLEQARIQEQWDANLMSRQAEISEKLNKKFALSDDTQIKLTFIQGVAFLQGTVDSKEKRKIAEIFVGFEPGITEVRNELKVVAP